MTTRNRGIVLVLVGVLALQMSLSDAMLTFLRASMRPWLVTAGTVLSLLGVGLLVRPRHLAGGHHHDLRVGWLLILPLCAGILAPQALDSRAAQRAAVWRNRFSQNRSFDLDAFLRAHALSGGVPRLDLSEFLSASDTPRQRVYLESHPVRLIGFVTPNPEGGGTDFYLTRFLMQCCAADAFPLRVDVTVPRGRAPAADAWVDIQVRLEPEPTERRAEDEVGPPVARLVSMHKVARPSEPYEYPG